MITDLVQKGYRVAITSNSHKVIDNLLLKIDTIFQDLNINQKIVKCDTREKMKYF